MGTNTRKFSIWAQAQGSLAYGHKHKGVYGHIHIAFLAESRN